MILCVFTWCTQPYCFAGYALLRVIHRIQFKILFGNPDWYMVRPSIIFEESHHLFQPCSESKLSCFLPWFRQVCWISQSFCWIFPLSFESFRNENFCFESCYRLVVVNMLVFVFIFPNHVLIEHVGVLLPY